MTDGEFYVVLVAAFVVIVFLADIAWSLGQIRGELRRQFAVDPRAYSPKPRRGPPAPPPPTPGIGRPETTGAKPVRPSPMSGETGEPRRGRLPSEPSRGGA